MSSSNDQLHTKLAKSESKDDINNLPNEVLGRILSLMPTKDAVATCILSSKWRNHYTLVDKMEFDDLGASKHVDRIRKMNIFWIFVSKVLSECKESNISKFRLKCGAGVWLPQFEDLIGSSCLKEVEELDVSFPTSKRLVRKPVSTILVLPDSVWQRLKVLKLSCNVGLAIPKATVLPNLRVFFLNGVTLVQDLEADGLSEFLSKCPLLEEVDIQGCDWKGTDLYVSSPLLRRFTLEIRNTINNPARLLTQFKWRVVHLDAPSLVYLRYCESSAGQFVIRNLSSIVDVHLNVGFSDVLLPNTQYSAVYHLIKGVRGCKSLYLSHQCLEVLTSGDFEIPSFHNLTHLELEVVTLKVRTRTMGFLKLLASSPALEVLTMYQGTFVWYEELVDNGDAADADVPFCVTSRLKVIKIHRFRGLGGDVPMIKYLVANANVLEELSVSCHYEMNGHVERDEILELPTASKSCSITFQPPRRRQSVREARQLLSRMHNSVRNKGLHNG